MLVAAVFLKRKTCVLHQTKKTANVVLGFDSGKTKHMQPVCKTVSLTSGAIPTEIGLLTALDQLVLHNIKGITGSLVGWCFCIVVDLQCTLLSDVTFHLVP